MTFNLDVLLLLFFFTGLLLNLETDMHDILNEVSKVVSAT